MEKRKIIMKPDSIRYTKEKDQMLLRIARHLILNASFLSNIGLYHGKMGIVIFFAHYTRYTGDDMYMDFAGELIDEVYEEIHAGMPVGLESGFCGIGWGIKYLLGNNFMGGNANEILAGVDLKIKEWNIPAIQDKSFSTGSAGISYYISECVDCIADDRKPLWNDLLSDIIGETPNDDNIVEWNLGLKNGCAGWGLKHILQ